MRQAGVLAAPGLVALRDMVERLAERSRPRRSAGRSGGTALALVRSRPAARAHEHRCVRSSGPRSAGGPPGEQGVLAHTIAPGRVRLVTHHDVDDNGIKRTLAALADAPDGDRRGDTT